MEKQKSKSKQFYDEELRQYNKIITIASLFVVLGTVFYHIVEKLTWLDSLYFTVITLATVGYGDITPKTSFGKLFTIFYVAIGISIFIALANTIIKRYMHKKGIKQENGKEIDKTP